MSDLSKAKRLHRMPHIFSRVLELPIPADFPVDCDETDTAFEFEATNCEEVVVVSSVEDVRTEVIDIVPGSAKKIVVCGLRRRSIGDTEEQDKEEEEMEANWRFRLTPLADPGAASATFENGVLRVVVSKVKSSCVMESNEQNGEHRNEPPVSSVPVMESDEHRNEPPLSSVPAMAEAISVF